MEKLGICKNIHKLQYLENGLGNNTVIKSPGQDGPQLSVKSKDVGVELFIILLEESNVCFKGDHLDEAHVCGVQ